MKFRITVQGKDSISNGVGEATYAQLESAGLDFGSVDLEKWEAAFEKERAKLVKLVSRFLIDGEGGNDSVTVEFDTDTKTCIVVPVKKKG